jgi:branched-chain amino acid transport system permease protein
MLIYSITAGLLFGLYFSLVGLGLNLVFGVMRIVNLAHGSFLMLGAFLAYYLFSISGLNPVYSAGVALALFTVCGIPLYYLIIPRLLASKNPEMLSLIFFFGMAQFIEAVATIAFGPTEHSIPARALGAGPVSIFGQGLPGAWAVAAGICACATGLVYLYLYRTRLGSMTRAVMIERNEALASGIDVHWTSAIAFGVSLGLAAAAGVMAPFMLGSISPAMGENINVASFAVIVIGSLGNPLGAVLGGLIYGVSLMLMQNYLSSWADLLPNVLLIAILLIKPSGLLGRKVRYA